MSYLSILRKSKQEHSEECQAYGPGRPSLENAARPIEARLEDARMLLNELHRDYEAMFFQFKRRGFWDSDAHLNAMQGIKQSGVYQKWRALG